MSEADSDNLSKFISCLEKEFSADVGVSCLDQIDHTRLSPEPLLSELVFSMLVWESSIEHAVRAVEAIEEQLIDLNELRVCTPEELTKILPARYPRIMERSERLIRVLNSIFMKENCLSLALLREKSKKEVVEYFASIDGLPLFVSSRVILLGLGWHAFPLDDWLCKQLAREGVTSSTVDVQGQTSWMERMIRASDSLKAYTLIEHWASSQRALKTVAHKKKLSRSGDQSNSQPEPESESVSKTQTKPVTKDPS